MAETDATFTLAIGRCGLKIGPGVYAWAGNRDAYLGKTAGRWEAVLGSHSVWRLDGWKMHRASL